MTAGQTATPSRANAVEGQRGTRLLVAVLMVLGITANVAGFSAADDTAPARWKALHSYESGDLATIVHADDDAFWQRYAPFFMLAVLAPGSRVLVPDGHPLGHPNIKAQLLGIGEVASVKAAPLAVVARILPQESTIGLADAAFDPAPFVVAMGESGDNGFPWAIALDDPDVRPRGMRDPHTLAEDLLGSPWQRAIAGPARDMLLLAWWTTTDGEPIQRRLFLETSLLPAALRELLP